MVQAGRSRQLLLLNSTFEHFPTNQSKLAMGFLEEVKSPDINTVQTTMIKIRVMATPIVSRTPLIDDNGNGWSLCGVFSY
jgi:hypothetical protein